MKIKGIIIISPLMFQMEPGQEGFLHSSATILVDNELFIDTRYSIASNKNSNTNHIIPIKRIGTGKDDFEIDFNITYYLYNQKLSEQARKDMVDDTYIIGPYPVETEIYQPTKYREQIYPRMDFQELITAFANIKGLIQISPDNKTYEGDETRLRKLIKTKLSELDYNELKECREYFSPLTETESEGGTIVNYIEDEKLMVFVQELIEERGKDLEWDNMSLIDLEKAYAAAMQEELYEKAKIIQAAITKKKQENN